MLSEDYVPISDKMVLGVNDKQRIFTEYITDKTWAILKEFFKLRLFQNHHLFGLVLITLSCQEIVTQFAMAAHAANFRPKG
jgi:hypothetical protein